LFELFSVLSERLQRCFISRYPVLPFVLEAAKPRMPVEFLQTFF